MGVVQKGPTSTLFFWPLFSSFFRLFSTFFTFLTKRNRPTDATFDKNRPKNEKIKNDKKTIKNKDKIKRSKKKYRLKKKAKKRKIDKNQIPSLWMGPKKSNPKNGYIWEMETIRQKTSKNMVIVHKKSIKSKIGQKRSKNVKKPEK